MGVHVDLPRPVAMPTVRAVLSPARKPWLRRLTWWRETVVYEVRDYPGYVLPVRIDGVLYELFFPWGFRTDLASSPWFSWGFGFRPDGVLALGSLPHDSLFRNGFLLDVTGRRLFEGASKGFADTLLKGITRAAAGTSTPGVAAHLALTVAGWPAWWAGKKCRDRVAADPDPDAYSLHGNYGD